MQDEVTKRPLEHIFRAMRVDQEDLIPTMPHQCIPDKKSYAFYNSVMMALDRGNYEKSPFLHGSTDYYKARSIHQKAQC